MAQSWRSMMTGLRMRDRYISIVYRSNENKIKVCLHTYNSFANLLDRNLRRRVSLTRSDEQRENRHHYHEKSREIHDWLTACFISKKYKHTLSCFRCECFLLYYTQYLKDAISSFFSFTKSHVSGLGLSQVPWHVTTWHKVSNLSSVTLNLRR